MDKYRDYVRVDAEQPVTDNRDRLLQPVPTSISTEKPKLQPQFRVVIFRARKSVGAIVRIGT